jgi:hypothetical protein
MAFSQTKLVVKDLQTYPLSNREVATKNLARTEWTLCKHKTNSFTKNICQELSEPRIIKPIYSPLLKTSPSLLYHGYSEGFRAIRRLKFGVDIFSFHPLKLEETDHRSLLHLFA